MKVWTQYAHMVSIFCKDLKKFILYFLPLKPRGGGRISPPVLRSFENGGDFTPGGGYHPLVPTVKSEKGGGYHPPVLRFMKKGGFHPRGGYHPLVLIWPQSTGGSGHDYDLVFFLAHYHLRY